MKALAKLLTVLLFVLVPFLLRAQCNHNPTITGDLILCPNEGGTITTQASDSYQWWSRPYGSSTTTIISGATLQDYAVPSNAGLTYFSVDATIAGCTERSPEALVDGWVFAGLDYILDGNFVPGPAGLNFCEGDSMTITLGMPYDTLITWYLNNVVITGADSTTLVVYQTGVYRASAAPSLCPNYIQHGLQESVAAVPCSTAVGNLKQAAISIYPNPAQDWVQLQTNIDATLQLQFLNSLGQLLIDTHLTAPGIQIDLRAYPKGMYTLRIAQEDAYITKRLILR